MHCLFSTVNYHLSSHISFITLAKSDLPDNFMPVCISKFSIVDFVIKKTVDQRAVFLIL
jgi:hypothetical protein